MGFAGGVVVLEVVLGVVGYAFMWPLLHGRSASTRLSYAGVAVVVGNGVCGAGAAVAAVAGARTTLGLMGGVAVATAAAGVAVALLVRHRVAAAPSPERRRPARAEELVALAAGTIVCAVAGAILYGGFRSTPWLDDSWFFWLPKGIVLDKLGLDVRLFVPNPRYETLTSPDYPLGWSILLGTGVRLAGRVDLRVVNAELAVMTVAFLGATARILWSAVRPLFVVCALALLAVSPEFERQALGGGADLPVAFFVVLFVLAAGAWLAHGDRTNLVLAGCFAAGGLATKTEAAPELLVAGVVLAAAAWREARDRLAALAGAYVVAIATAVPWFVWRQRHGVQDEISLVHALDPSYLSSRTSRLGPTWSTLSHDLIDVRSWAVIVPVFVLLTATLLVLERRPLVLAPLAAASSFVLILVWAYWADPLGLDYKLGTSAYRSVDTITLFTALACAVLADRIAAALAPRAKAMPPPANGSFTAGCENRGS